MVPFTEEDEFHLAKLKKVSPELEAYCRRIHAFIREPGEQQEKCDFIKFGIPGDIKNYFDSGVPSKETSAIQALDEEINNGLKTIMLVGRSGAGKTFAACRWLVTNQNGKFVTASHLASLNEKMQEDRTEYYSAMHIRALVIDDFGRSNVTSNDVLKLREIICNRADDKLFTICTCNELPFYGEALTRRMKVRMV